MNLLALACALALAAAQPPVLQRELASPDLVVGYRGALLAKNGAQTTCEVALLGMSAGFVAASCLDFARGAALDAATKLEVWVDRRAADAAVTRYTVAPGDVHVHPGYSPSTLANNLAVIQFNKDTSEKYSSPIQTDYNVEAQQIYTQRAVDDASGKWRTPATSSQVHDSHGCGEASPLVSGNPNRFSCTGALARSVYHRTCRVSYGSMYTGEPSALVLAGLHSHTLVYGNSTCGDSLGWLSYYTLLGPYTGFAVAVLNRPIDIYQNGALASTASNLSSDMAPAVGAAPSKTTTWTGDFNAFQRKDEAAPESSALATSLRPLPVSGATEAESAGDETSSSNSSSSSSAGHGLSTTAKIIIGVLVPLGVIIAAIAAVIGYNLWRIRRRDRAWNPRAQVADIQSTAWGLSTGLPAYTDLAATRNSNVLS
ncbi:hypothetical protein H4R19_004486 [Coemansia spiralis]|nr:hypothetical protein H4R19_004486 [Coemansia spiralis]